MRFLAFSFICPPLLTAIVMASISPLISASNNQCAQPGSLPPSLSNGFAELDSNSERVQHIMVSELSPLPIQHDLVLAKGEKNSETAKTYKSLIANLRAENRLEVVRHVRSVTVKDAIPSEDLLLVLDTISSRGGILQTLHWNTPTHIPKPVLDSLNTKFRSLEIHAKVLDRAGATSQHRRIDTPLLTSPLLTSLTYQIFVRGYQVNVPTLSEWPNLSRCLEVARNLKVLRLEISRDDLYDGTGILASYPYHSIVAGNLPRLDVSNETRLPSLKEFTLREQRHYGASTYLWDAEHCVLLLNSSDWSSLIVLEFGPDLPVAFFETFISHLPGLKKLRFGFDRETTLSDLRIVRRFMESVEVLEGLDIDQPKRGIDTLWPAVLMHTKTLKDLILRPSHARYYEPEYMSFEMLEEIVQTFPVLERLGWDVPLLGENVDPKYVDLFSRLSSLRHLDIFLHLPTSSTPYSPAQTFIPDTMGEMSAPPLDVSSSRDAAIEIIEIISRKAKRPLERLTMHFSRTGYGDRMETYLTVAKLQVRRGVDGKYEFRGRQEWNGISSLGEEMWLEED